MSEQPYGKDYAGNPAKNYERFFVPAIGGPVAADLMEAVPLSPDDRVLDVACGTGVVTRLAAQRAASVTGVDINAGMLDVAREAAPADAQIEWHESSADALPFPEGAYDVVLCQLSMQFFPDKPAALREMKRVLAPGGRLALNLPGRITPAFEALDGAVGRHVGPEAGAFVQAVFSLHDPDEVQGLLAAEGFEDVNVTTKTMEMTLPPPQEFVWQYIHSTPLTEAVSRLDDEHLAAIERDMVEGSRSYVRNGGMSVAQEIVLATARKPSS